MTGAQRRAAGEPPGGGMVPLCDEGAQRHHGEGHSPSPAAGQFPPQTMSAKLRSVATAPVKGSPTEGSNRASNERARYEPRGSRERAQKPLPEVREPLERLSGKSRSPHSRRRQPAVLSVRVAGHPSNVAEPGQPSERVAVLDPPLGRGQNPPERAGWPGGASDLRQDGRPPIPKGSGAWTPRSPRSPGNTAGRHGCRPSTSERRCTLLRHTLTDSHYRLCFSLMDLLNPLA